MQITIEIILILLMQLVILITLKQTAKPTFVNHLITIYILRLRYKMDSKSI